MQFPTKIITIEAVSDKEDKKQAAIKADDGNWYTVWRDYEGTKTTEYNQLTMGNHNEAFKKGDRAIISYKTGVFNNKTQYTLKSIFPAQDSNTSSNSAPAGNSQPGANSGVSEAPKGDVFWDMKAYKQCLWNYWLEVTPGKVLTKEDTDMVWAIFKGIEEDADKRFNPSKLRQAVAKYAPKIAEPDLPVIDVGEADGDMPVEGIPF
jgi:hypothetical protein